MKLKKLFSFALALIATAGAWAQQWTDVTDDYITNAGMSTTDGWTKNGSSNNFFDFANGLIGAYKVRSDKATATVDDTHLNTEYCFGLECRWSTSYAYYTQQTENLPAGVYQLTYDVENVNGSTTSASYENKFTVTVSSNTYSDTSTEWARGKSSWTTHTISFTLEEAASVTISLGYGTGSNNIGSNNTPVVYVSHLKLKYQSLLEGVKALWQEALDAANSALVNSDYSNVSGEERDNLQAETGKAEPTTKQGYEEATEALNDLTSAFTSAKASYDAFEEATNVDVPDLAYASAERLSALNNALEATPTSASDAETKTADIISKLRAYYESHALAEGVEGALNVTDQLANPNAADGNNGWTWTGNKNNPASNEPWTDSDGNSTHTYFDGGNWNGSNWTTTMEQSVTLPAGKYLLTVKERASTNVTFTMEAGGESMNMLVVGNTGGVFNRGWNDASVEFETEGDPVTIKVTASASPTHEWFSISQFRLVRLELHVEMADEDDYEALQEAVTAAEAKILGFDEGEFAPYTNVEAINALVAAQNVDTNAENSKEDVNNITEALTSATWTANTEEMNGIYDGQFANTEANSTSGDINLPGWTKVQGIRLLVKDTTVNPGLEYTDGKAAVFSWGGTTLTYGEQTGYTLPLNNGETYELTLKVSAWSDGDFPNVFTVKLDNDTKTVNPTELGVKPINTSDGNPFVSLSFRLKASAEGDSNLTIFSNHHFTIADLCLKLAGPLTFDELADNTNMEAEENVSVVFNRTIKVGYNTVCLPMALSADQVAETFGEGSEIYTFSEEESDGETIITFAKSDETTISANVPVIVKATQASTSQTFEKVSLTPSNEPVAEGTNIDFVGTYARTTVPSGDYYISNGVLYKSSGDTNISAFRAYLHAKSGNAVKLFIGDTPTSIDAVHGLEIVNDGAFYDLSGKRVNKAAKGIYIINGKKVMMK